MSRGRPEIDCERCKGCALCVDACPEKIMSLSKDRFNRQGLPFAVCIDESRCTACMFCAILCPDSAISILRFAAVSGV